MDIKKIVTIILVLTSFSSFSAPTGFTAKELDELDKSFFKNKDRMDASIEKLSTSDISTDSIDTDTLTVNSILRNFSEMNEKKMRAAMLLLEKVVNSEEFKDALIGFTYKGKLEYVQNNGMTNEQIYHYLMMGKEVLSPQADLEMDLDVSLYSQRFGRCSVVGYTKPRSSQIFVNRCFFNKFELSEVAGNLFHEWIHKIGFVHDYKATARRPFSVPYALGYLVRTLGAKYQKEFNSPVLLGL